MHEAVIYLASTRQIEAEYKAKIAEAEAELRATGTWRYLEQQRECLKVAQADVADATADVRKQALAIYDETGSKSPHPAVKVKMYTVLDYDDGEAVKYALLHLPQALKLVKRDFEKAAKVLGLDFVTISQTPRASIAHNLDEFTEQAGDEGTKATNRV